MVITDKMIDKALCAFYNASTSSPNAKFEWTHNERKYMRAALVAAFKLQDDNNLTIGNIYDISRNGGSSR